MTLRVALVVDGNSSGAQKAVDGAAGSVRQLSAATHEAAGAGNQLTASASREAVVVNAVAVATHAQNAAMLANVSLNRQAAAQRTNLIFQLNDIAVSLASGMNPAMVAMQQGSQISTIYGPGGMGKALSETGKIAVGMAGKFGPLLAITAVVSAGIAGLTHEINRTGEGIDVSFGDVAMGILQTFAANLYGTVKPAVDAVARWFEANWATVAKVTGDVVNFMVRGFMGFGLQLQHIMADLPDYFTLGAEAAAKAFLVPIQFMVDQTVGGINVIVDALNKLGAGIKPIDPFKINADFGGNNALKMIEARKAAYAKLDAENQQTDYAGNFFSDLADNARENAKDRQKPEKAGKKSDFEREIASIRERTAALQVEGNVIGLDTFASEKLRKTFELENAARKDAIGLTPKRIAEIEKEATAYAAAAAAVEQQKGAFEEISRVGESAIDSLVDSFFDGGKNIGDVLKGIAKDYAKMVLEMAVTNPIKNALFGGSNPTFGGGGGGGLSDFLGNLLKGMFGGAPKYASGTSNHPGGLARINDGGGGEIVMLPGGSKVIPNDLSRQMVAGGGGDANVTVNVINNSGAEVRQSRKKNADGSVIQELVIGTVQRGMANDDFRANGVRGRTMSR